MKYAYYICPNCKDKFFEEQNLDGEYKDFERYNGEICPNCKSKLVLACAGNKKAGNTVYKIVMQLCTNEEACKEAIMEINNCDEIKAMEKINNENSVICEGDLLKTYLSMDILDGAVVVYKVVPEFEYTRYIYMGLQCPECGGILIRKREDDGEGVNHYKDGFVCENCGEWFMSAL